MEIFKGKIELKCIEAEQIGVTSLGVSGDSTFQGGVTFYEQVNGVTFSVENIYVDQITGITSYIENIHVTSANIDNLGVSTMSVENLNVTNLSVTGLSVHDIEFLSGITIGDLDTSCINADKIIVNDATINTLSVTGAADYTNDVDFFGIVTFHNLVVGITAGGGGGTINGVSGFFLDPHGNLTIEGDINVEENLNVDGDSTFLGGVSIAGDLCAMIGNPTDDGISRPIDISGTTYTNNIGLNLDATMKIADGFQIIDHYFKTYFLCPPPGVSLVGCTATPEDLSIEWENFPKVEYAPLDIYLPHVIENRVDYVKSSLNGSQDWSDASSVTIQTTSRDTNKVVFHTQGSGSGLTSTTWDEYTIDSATNYDIRIYGINHHSGEPMYLEVLSKSTSSIGVPIAPTSLSGVGASTTTINTSWTKPVDHDDVTAGDNTFPIIERYAVDFTASDSVRYPTYLADSGTQYTSLTVDPTNSATNLTLTGLNPGTEYTITVAGKNAINSTDGPNTDGYGAESLGTTGLTSLPSKPPLLSTSDSNALNNVSTLRSPYLSNGGYSLDGQTASSPIVRFANINDTSQPLRTTTSPNVRNNETAGTTSLNTATLYAYGGLDSQYQSNDVVSENIDGYSHASNVGNFNGTKVRLRIDSDGDYYSSPSDGFYKSFTMYAQGLTSAAFYPASTSKYVLGLRYQSLDGGSDITTDKVNFYVDDLNTNPTLSGVYITEETVGASASTQISGVPTYKNNASFRFQFTTSEMANYFLRHDRKHAEALLETSGNVALSSTLTIQKISNSVSTGNVDGTTHQYWEAPPLSHQRSSSLHNTIGQTLATNPGDIQLHSFEIPLTSAADSKFDENFRVQVTPFNLYSANSSGSAVTGIYVNPGITAVTQSKLRIDTKSVENDRSASATTDSLGRHVQSGTGQYPNLGTTQAGQAGGDYDHAESLLGGISGNYAEELQLVNGSYQGVSGSDGYKNYNQSSPNNYYFPTSYTFYDYSSISSGVTTNRYVTFKYTGVIPAGTTRERLRFTINGMSGLTVDFSQFDQANHQFLVRVVDIGDGSDLEAHTTTLGWLDGTNTVGQNGILKGDNGTRCINGGTSTATQRDCFIRVGTTENAIIYVRVGIPNNTNARLTNITCVAIDGNFT